MGIISNGQNFSDQQIKDFFASNPNGDQIASEAARLGLNQDQIASAMQIGGAAGSAQDAHNQINTYMGSTNPGAYAWGANGGAQAAQQPNTQPNNPAGGMNIGGQYYSQQQIKDFYAGGGDDNKWLQQNGVTDLNQIHDISNQARRLAGDSNLTGDASTQAYFKRYQQTTPNGVYANDYNAWLRDQQPAVINAMRAGSFTGVATTQEDYSPGGIFGPGSAAYGKPGYASGLGALGNNDGWGSGAPGAGGGAGGGGGNGGGGSSGSWGGSSSGSGGAGAGGNGNVTPWNVGAEQTVEGRINGILNPNNPIIQQARTQAMEGMNSRGLTNSSIATTAADAAAYQAAIPIAAADAATFGKAAGYNADQSNQFTQADLNRNLQRELAALNADTQKYIANMDSAYRQTALDVQTSNATLLQTNGQASQAFNTAMSAINNITNNAQMDAAAKTQATANVWLSLKTQLDVLSKTSGLNLSGQLNFAGQPGFDSKGNWVGFGDAGAGAPAAPAGGILDPNKYPVSIGGSA